jgi:hypothetical protein
LWYHNEEDILSCYGWCGNYYYQGNDVFFQLSEAYECRKNKKDKKTPESGVGLVSLAIINVRKLSYKDKNIVCVLYTNLAVYCLKFEEYYPQALQYAQLSITFAASSHDASKATNAKIIKQIAHFKIEDGLYNEKKLIKLIKIFAALEWHQEYHNAIGTAKSQP